MTNRLEELQKELEGILESRFLELRKEVQRTEHLSREIMRAELTTQTNIEKQQSLEDELAALTQVNNQELHNLSEIKNTCAALEEERQNLQKQKALIITEIEKNTDFNAQVKEEIKELESRNADLDDENTKLKLQADFLRENIAKLRRLKEENMLSVMNLTTNMQEVSSGKD